MLIARDKKENNIAEYVIYIWQLEDLLRANQLNIELVERNIISNFQQSEETLAEIRSWYANFIAIMNSERIEKSGHAQFIRNTVNDLYQFHLDLLKTSTENEYRELYKIAAPDISEFQKKGKHFYDNEIETMFSALYSVLLMNLQKRKISEGTQIAISNFSKLLSLLAFKYHKNEKGNSEMED